MRIVCPQCGCVSEKESSQCLKCGADMIAAPSSLVIHSREHQNLPVQKLTPWSAGDPPGKQLARLWQGLTAGDARDEIANVTYAGFPRRLKAGFADAVILSCFESAIGLMHSLNGAQTVVSVNLPLMFLLGVVSATVPWFYFVYFESSKYQATPGKMLFGIKVTDIEGRRFTFWRAIAKQFLQGLIYVSITLICYIPLMCFAAASHSHMGAGSISLMYIIGLFFLNNLAYVSLFCVIAFSERKQTVFDRLTKRLVVLREATPQKEIELR